jgi:D-threonate/D-erythronate kinase
MELFGTNVYIERGQVSVDIVLSPEEFKVKQHKFIVIADDFTGSNDCGAQLKNYCLSTATILNKEYLNDIYGYDAVVIDSETRSMSKTDSYNKITEIALSIKDYMQDSFIYKKIDSTLRGHIGAEIKALNDVLNPDMIVFAPAYPENKRTTLHGIQHLNGIPIDKTELARDPKNPITTADIREILKVDTGIDFIHIDIESIRNDEVLRILQDSGCRYVSFDAETNSDLETITKQVISLNKTVLWVGSAGLTSMLINYIRPEGRKYKPVLAVVGSINSTSAMQAQRALMDNNIKSLIINIEKAILNPEEEKRILLKEIFKQIDESRDILIASALDSGQIIAASTLGVKLGLSLSEISVKIGDFIGETVNEVLKQRQISGLFLTGGDTAINVIRRLSAKGSAVIEEIEAGVPFVTLLGGPYEGLRMITKAGGFGSEYTIVNAVNYLRSKD